MSTQLENGIEVEQLDLNDAKVSMVGNVNYYQWDSSIPGGKPKAWSTGVSSGQKVVSGGIHVYGWRNVLMTDSYPSDSATRRLGAVNNELSSVDVTLYAIGLA